MKKRKIACCRWVGRTLLFLLFHVRTVCSEQFDLTCVTGSTAENVAKDFNISRRQQDEYGVESNRRAELAQKNGCFDDEVVPINVVQRDGKTATLSRDEIRYGTTYDSIAKLKPAFPDYGNTVNAGNSSQLTDGISCPLSDPYHKTDQRP